MNVIFILIAVSLLVAIGFLVAFIWTIRTGQFEDEYTPSVRVLFDDEKNIIEENSKYHPPAGGPNAKQNSNSKSKRKINEQKQKQQPLTNQKPLTNKQEPGTRNPEPGTRN